MTTEDEHDDYCSLGYGMRLPILTRKKTRPIHACIVGRLKMQYTLQDRPQGSHHHHHHHHVMHSWTKRKSYQ